MDQQRRKEMRLWHKDIIQFLPRTQLLSQWRELNSIYKFQNKHILINYIYEYPKIYLYAYSQIVINEMKKMGYKISSWDNYNDYFKDCIDSQLDNDYLSTLSYKEHDDTYFLICIYNLYEKGIRGQTDFPIERYNSMCDYYARNIDKSACLIRRL